jgi:choline dehydrogenase
MLVAFAPKAENVDPNSVMSEHGYQLYIAGTRPTSTGSVSLRSSDPAEDPVIRFNYLATEDDRQFWPRAIRRVREIFAQPAFAAVDAGETVPGPSLLDDDALLSWVRKSAGSGYHPTSTCRMGVDEGAVVDPKSMRVHGLDGLRVVDASVMPHIVTSNTYSTVVMIAEKSADIILGKSAPDPADLSHLVLEARPGA